MNIKTVFRICCLLSIVSLFEIHPSILRAAPPAASDSGAPLTGSTLKIEDIIPKTEAIFVGRIAKVWDAPPSFPGGAGIPLDVDTTRVFKGTVSGRVKLIAFILAQNEEVGPKAGSSYIFFVTKDHEFLEAAKLVPATDDSVAKLKTLLPAP